jgi:hypothetical protein
MNVSGASCARRGSRGNTIAMRVISGETERRRRRRAICLSLYNLGASDPDALDELLLQLLHGSQPPLTAHEK